MSSAFSLIGNDAYRYLTLSAADVNSCVARLKSKGFLVKALQGGFSCEDVGEQIFRATQQESGQYSVRLNARFYPDV